MKYIFLIPMLFLCTSINTYTPSVDAKLDKIERNIEQLNVDIEKMNIILNDPERLKQIKNNNR